MAILASRWYLLRPQGVYLCCCQRALHCYSLGEIVINCICLVVLVCLVITVSCVLCYLYYYYYGINIFLRSFLMWVKKNPFSAKQFVSLSELAPLLMGVKLVTFGYPKLHRRPHWVVVCWLLFSSLLPLQLWMLPYWQRELSSIFHIFTLDFANVY